MTPQGHEGGEKKNGRGEKDLVHVEDKSFLGV